MVVIPWACCHPGTEIYCGRHHKSVIVVGVLSDQIDPPGRAKHLGDMAKSALKIGDKRVESGMGHGRQSCGRPGRSWISSSQFLLSLPARTFAWLNSTAFSRESGAPLHGSRATV